VSCLLACLLVIAFALFVSRVWVGRVPGLFSFLSCVLSGWGLGFLCGWVLGRLPGVPWGLSFRAGFALGSGLGRAGSRGVGGVWGLAVVFGGYFLALL